MRRMACAVCVLLVSASSLLAQVDRDAFKQTMNFWQNWIGRSQYRGRWREVVNRSALTLKLLASQPHGALVTWRAWWLGDAIGAASRPHALGSGSEPGLPRHPDR